MKRNPTVHSKTATALTNAQPEFVSIVKAGANMIPFRSMKSADKPENNAMHLKTKSDTHDIAKLVFKGEHFTSEELVGAWLVAGGYDRAVIVKEADGTFSVTDTAAPTEGLSEVETANGVTAYIFEKPSAVAKTADTAAQVPSPEGLPSVITTDGVAPVAAVKGADEPVVTEGAKVVVVGKMDSAVLEALRTKFDSWDVEWSDELTLTDALADGFDGVPPGMCEVLCAVYTATRNAVIAGSPDSIPAIFADAAKLIMALAALFPSDIPFSIDMVSFKSADAPESPFKPYMTVKEDGTVELDKNKLLGDVMFPAFTIKQVADAAEPAYCIEPVAAPVLLGFDKGTEVVKSVESKRHRILAKVAAKKPKETPVNGTAAEPAPTVKTEPAQENAEVVVKTTAEATGDALTAAVSAALTPALTALSNATTAMTAQQEAHKAELAVKDAELAQVKKEAAEAIEAVKAATPVERQSRKAADADEHTTGNTADTTKTKTEQAATSNVQDLRMRGALGMSRRVRGAQRT